MDKFVAVAAVTGLFISFSFFAMAQSSPEVCLKHLQVNEALKQKWNPGIVRNNSKPSGGMMYLIEIKVKKNGYITFNKLITENEVLDVEVMKGGNRNVTGPFEKGDAVTIIARSEINKQSPAPDSAISSKIKSKHAAGAILYTYKDKQYLHTLDRLTETENKKLSQ
jgi:hypothetical protein